MDGCFNTGSKKSLMYVCVVLYDVCCCYSSCCWCFLLLLVVLLLNKKMHDAADDGVGMFKQIMA